MKLKAISYLALMLGLFVLHACQRNIMVVPALNGTPTYTATALPTGTFTSTVTYTPTGIATNTPSETMTNSPTGIVNTSTPTNTVTNTPTGVINTATCTATNSCTGTWTMTQTNTPTNMVANTSTNTPTSTPTNQMATSTFTPSFTPNPSASWKYVGSQNFYTHFAGYLSLQCHGGTPYVGFMDGNQSSGNVLSYSGGVWSSLGSADFFPWVDYFTFSIASDGTPYAAGQEGVYQYSGSWATYGNQSIGAAIRTVISTYNNVPYIESQDGTGGDVIYYSSGNWVQLGGAYFTTEGINTDSMAIDNSGNVYVAWSDTSGNVSVSCFEQSNQTWKVLGSANFATTSSEVSVAVGSDGTAYLAISDKSNSGKAAVMSYNGGANAWAYLGTPALSSAQGYYACLAVNGTTPYVSFVDVANNYEPTVMSYSGSWSTVGSADFVSTSCDSLCLAINNGVPYVAFANSTNISVMEYQ